VHVTKISVCANGKDM